MLVYSEASVGMYNAVSHAFVNASKADFLFDTQRREDMKDA
jgi:hypothetical protein